MKTTAASLGRNASVASSNICAYVNAKAAMLEAIENSNLWPLWTGLAIKRHRLRQAIEARNGSRHPANDLLFESAELRAKDLTRTTGSTLWQAFDKVTREVRTEPEPA